MEQIRLGRTGVRVPAIGLGTWSYGGARVDEVDDPVGWSDQDDQRSLDALVRAWERGLTHWDTADVYGDGHSEALIGSLWDRVPRDRIFLASKTGWDKGGHDHYYHPERVRRQLERSLRLLRTDVIDLYYLHHCHFGDDDRHLDDALERFHRFREEGKVRFLGLSDWDPAQVARLAPRVDPDVVQPYRNVLEDGYRESGLEAWVEAHDVGVMFFSPLKHGLLLGKHAGPRDFPAGDFRQRVWQFRDPATLERLAEAARQARERFAHHPHPVLHAVVDALLTGTENAGVLLGQRGPAQVEAAATLGEPLSAEDAAWVRRTFGE